MLGSKEIIDTIVYPDKIEIVYKQSKTASVYPDFSGFNNPIVFKEVYSRTDGSVEIVNGKYIPEQTINEGYEF